MANRKLKKRALLSAQTAYAEEPRAGWWIPVRYLNNVIAIFLTPVAALLSLTFFEAFRRETLHHGFWATEEFWFFMVGALFWLVLFFGTPRKLFPVLTYIYVFGHEWTHAVWVFLMGGRVSKIKFGSAGGHILTDTHNFWIALAPYFYPIYSMALLVAYFVASCFLDVQPFHRWFFALLGFTWAFHISFTLWMIPKGQSDLAFHGNFFSIVVIWIANVVVLSVMLIVASPHVTFAGFARELFHNALDFSALVFGLVKKGIAGLGPRAA